MAKFWLEDGEVKSDEPLNKFIQYQMEEIRLGLETGLDVSVYADPKYNTLQMAQIRLGRGQGMDVSVYANPKFDGWQMAQIRWGLEEGLDASVYADPRLDQYQMEQIRLGLGQGLDVSVYADPKFDEKKMFGIRCTMESRVMAAAIEDLWKHGRFVDPGEADLRADGIYVDDQKVTTMDDLKVLYPRLEFNDLRESLSGLTTDDREVDAEEESLDGE